MAFSTQDSPLSITASVSGILTFLAAILAAVYVRFTYLRNADSEYFQVKASLSWFKTESTFMHDLVSTSSLHHALEEMEDEKGDARSGSEVSGRGRGKEREMYAFVVEQLGKLEERLLECLAEAEEGVDRKQDRDGEKGGEGGGWTIVPRSVRGRTDIAISWLPVRRRALELVRQRDALGSRVLFAQMSMISS
ncbi:hypothetical protein F5882DRAFT_146379 [Hyaloscypha sp. PMI_1271]|nr:hypothetical protein F5882DRAFT_146379 [Hyaloscypha sp. PMI_1271]